MELEPGAPQHHVDIQHPGRADNANEPEPESFDHFLLGLKCFYNGLALSWKNKQVHEEQSKSTLLLISVVGLLYFSLVAIVSPIHLILWLVSLPLSLIGWGRAVTEFSDSISFSTIFWSLLWFLPLVFLFVTRTVIGTEPQFFSVLDELRPQSSGLIKQTQPHSVIFALWRTLKVVASSYFAKFLYSLGRFSVAFMPLVVFYHLRFMPFQDKVGLSLAVMALMWAFYSTLKMFVVFLPWFLDLWKRWNRVGAFLAVATSILCLFSSSLSLLVMQLYIASMAISRELLDPFFCRLRPSVVEAMEKKSFNRCRWLLCGFGLPTVMLLSVPVLGFAMWGYVQGAAALCFVEYERLMQVDYSLLDKSNRDE